MRTREERLMAEIKVTRNRSTLAKFREGVGRRLTPSLRGAITEEDRQEWDEDAWAEYLKGGHGIYGVECETCAGKRVVLVMDEERIDKKLSARIHREVRRRAREREEDRRTYNMECQIFND